MRYPYAYFLNKLGYKKNPDLPPNEMFASEQPPRQSCRLGLRGKTAPRYSFTSLPFPHLVALRIQAAPAPSLAGDKASVYIIASFIILYDNKKFHIFQIILL